MLSLPSKPWKKIAVQRSGEGRYLITFVSPIEDEQEFEKIIDEDLGLCLSVGDALSEPSWSARSIVLTTDDFDLFKKRLVYVCIMIEKD
jgi:hypothetical protein